MNSSNSIQLIGNLSEKPELQTLQSGTQMSRMRLATNNKFTTQEGETKEFTEWHTVVVWGGLAKHCADTFDKGSNLVVLGSIEYRNYEAKDGQQKYFTEIKADTIRDFRKSTKPF